MINTERRFWNKVDIKSDDECWNWKGKYRASAGYGRLDIWGEDGVYAHRVAYLIAHPYCGISLRAPKDVKNHGFVLHSCDNPACCNPKHLYLGNNDQNIRDKVKRGRQPKYPKCTGPRCKFTEHDVREIRRMKKEGATIMALALLYDCSRSAISHMCYGRSYQDVE